MRADLKDFRGWDDNPLTDEPALTIPVHAYKLEFVQNEIPFQWFGKAATAAAAEQVARAELSSLSHVFDAKTARLVACTEVS